MTELLRDTPILEHEFRPSGCLHLPMAILRITANWTGFVGAPGYTNLHFLDVAASQGERDDTAAAVRAFFGSVSNLMPGVVSITFPTSADILDEETGQLVESVPMAAQTVVTGGGSSTYAAPVGAVVGWSTNTIISGRRLRGRTFLVPLSTGSYQSDGSLVATSVTTLANAAAALVANTGGVPLVVWSRPRPGQVGAAGIVTGATVPDRAAVLRSRRD